MTYSEVLAAIHSRKTFSSKASLDRIRPLMERLGNPQDQYRCIHVAGTNGKGSVCAMVESALRHAGYRVGLFTSPYLVEFRERIQIGREQISENALIAAYEEVVEAETALEGEGSEPINEFELVTAIGFVAFRNAGVEYAVIEVGLGGRFDATNVLRSPAACCISSISLDHTTVLGDTLEKIAGEKAGIMKPGCPVVMADQKDAAAKVLREQAADLGCPLKPSVPWEILSRDITGQELLLDGYRLRLPLLGDHQAENAAAAWSVCASLGLSPDQIREGLSTVYWPGRLHYVNQSPPILIDAGHNPDGVAALCHCLDTLFTDRSIIAVMAMMRDKDCDTCIPMVAKRACRMIAATVNLPRSLPVEELKEIAEAWCPVDTAQSVRKGLNIAKEYAEKDTLILVCGSVYAAGEALSTL